LVSLRCLSLLLASSLFSSTSPAAPRARTRSLLVRPRALVAGWWLASKEEEASSASGERPSLYYYTHHITYTCNKESYYILNLIYYILLSEATVRAERLIMRPIIVCTSYVVMGTHPTDVRTSSLVASLCSLAFPDIQSFTWMLHRR
jgi:hypothetical protein